MKNKHKRLFPYIPFYIARHEKALVSGNGIGVAAEDLAYFRDAMARLHKGKGFVRHRDGGSYGV